MCHILKSNDLDALLNQPLAAVDMGSNSFRLEIAKVRDGRYKRLDYLKTAVRLGSGLDESGLLLPEAIERGLSALTAMSDLLRQHEVGQVRAVATQTLREARNRNHFLTLAEPALGYPIEIISGREEARLIFSGVAHCHPSDEPRLVIDIGGRSTELVLGQGLEPGTSESFGIGSQSLSQRFFPEGQMSAAAFRAAQIAAGAEFEEAERLFTPDLWRHALASSGTAGAVSNVLATHGVTDGRLTQPALAWCIERCLEAGHSARLELRGLKDERRAVLPGGLAILYTLMSQFQIEEMFPASAALRQGVIFDLDQRRKVSLGVVLTDLRDSTVARLQNRFEVDVRQAARVRRLALQLKNILGPELSNESARELAWACELHEIGMMVSHHDHHRHSSYLLSHLDAPGFSQSQQRRIGELVLGQRGGLRKVEAAFAREDFGHSLLCLRLAALCCHSRADDSSVGLVARRTRSGSIRLGWSLQPGQERALHPDLRTIHLLKEEVALWNRARMLDLLWED